MKISGKRINHVASPAWTFADYKIGKEHIRDKNFKRSFSKTARRFVKNETRKLIAEAI